MFLFDYYNKAEALLAAKEHLFRAIIDSSDEQELEDVQTLYTMEIHNKKPLVKDYSAKLTSLQNDIAYAESIVDCVKVCLRELKAVDPVTLRKVSGDDLQAEVSER